MLRISQKIITGIEEAQSIFEFVEGYKTDGRFIRSCKLIEAARARVRAPRSKQKIPNNTGGAAGFLIPFCLGCDSCKKRFWVSKNRLKNHP